MILASLFFALAQTPKADVLVIVLDDVGAGDLAVAENIQALAARSLVFTRAYAWPICSPSRYAATFGQLPRRSGMGDICNTYAPLQSPSPYPDRRLLSLAEALKPSHRTALFGKYHLGRPGGLLGELHDVASSPFVQGFDVWRAGSPDSIGFGGGTGYYSWDRVQDGARSTSTVYATDQQADEFLAWWTGAPAATRPRFGWLALSAAHAPYDTPPGYPAQDATRAAYEAVLDYADRRLGDVLIAVDLETTYVLLCGDNGTPDDARPPGSPSGIWKGTTREGGVRVPLMLAGPGIVPGCTSRLVSLVDVPATVCDLLGVPWTSADSISMVGPVCRQFVFAERYTFAEHEDQAVIEANWKLRRVDPDGPQGPLGIIEETYWVGGGGEVPLVPPASVLARLRDELASLPPRMP